MLFLVKIYALAESKYIVIVFFIKKKHTKILDALTLGPRFLIMIQVYFTFNI